jgi:hypothetical protein
MLRNLTNKIFNKNLAINPKVNNAPVNKIIFNQKFNFFTNKINPLSKLSSIKTHKYTNASISNSNLFTKINTNFSPNKLNQISKKNFLSKIKNFSKIYKNNSSEPELSHLYKHPTYENGQDFYINLIEKLELNKKFKESEKKNLLEKLKSFNDYYTDKNNKISKKHYLEIFEEIKKATNIKYKDHEEENKRLENYQTLRTSKKFII